MLRPGAEYQRPERTQFQVALILRSAAVANEIGNDGRRILRQLVDLVGYIVEGAIDMGVEHLKAVGQHTAQRVHGCLRPDLLQQPGGA